MQGAKNALLRHVQSGTDSCSSEHSACLLTVLSKPRFRPAVCNHTACYRDLITAHLTGGGPGAPGAVVMRDRPAARRLLGFLGSLGSLPSPPLPPANLRGFLQGSQAVSRTCCAVWSLLLDLEHRWRLVPQEGLC